MRDAVCEIAENRPSARGQMDPNLMRPAGHQLTPDQRPSAAGAEVTYYDFDRNGFDKTQADLLWTAGLSYRLPF